VTVTAAAGLSVQHGTDTSTDAYIGRGFISGRDEHTHLPRPAVVADVGVKWTLDLITLPMPTQEENVERRSGRAWRPSRWLPYDLDTNREVFPPESVLDGDGHGLAVFRNIATQRGR